MSFYQMKLMELLKNRMRRSWKWSRDRWKSNFTISFKKNYLKSTNRCSLMMLEWQWPWFPLLSSLSLLSFSRFSFLVNRLKLFNIVHKNATTKLGWVTYNEVPNASPQTKKIHLPIATTNHHFHQPLPLGNPVFPIPYSHQIDPWIVAFMNEQMKQMVNRRILFA